MSDTITITGNLAADPEQRLIGNGTTVTSFRVASSQRHRDKDSGNWVETEPNWYQVSAFRGLGAHAFASLHRGERVIVTGRLKVRRWENEKGKGMSVEIDAEAIGHDLLWGTTRYTRAGAADQWNVPGADAAAGPTTEGQAEWATTQPGEGRAAALDASATGGPTPGSSSPDWGAPGADVPSPPPLPATPTGTERELADAPF
nr:single-stranded DNA-binding protein [Microbacterium bovistercoris]